MKIINYFGILILYLLVSYSSIIANDNSLPSYKEMNKAVKFINKSQELNNYLGDNFNINETEKKIEHYKGKFTTNDRDECFVFLPCKDETAPPDVEFTDFGVLFYKENNKWKFSKDYVEIDSMFILDFDNDEILEIYVESFWFKMGEFGIYHAIYSYKSGELITLFNRTTDDFDEKVDETEEPDYSYLNQAQRYLYEFEFKKNPDNTTNLIQTYKIGTLKKYRTKTAKNEYKYKTTVSNYALKNGKFVKVKNPKTQKSKKNKN